jgi:hypothetical protein
MDRPRLIVVQDLSDRTGTTLRRVRPEELGTTSRELNECLTKLRFGNPRDPTHADEVIQANIEANILDVLSEHFPSAISKSYWPLSIVDAADERPALALMAAGALLALALPVAVGFRLHRTASRLTPRE